VVTDEPRRKAESSNIEPKLFEIEVAQDFEPQIRQLPYPIWTENKAKLIAKYIFLFELITKHGTYIDGFAGPQRADRPEMWAAKLVLEIEPKWLRHFFLFEKSKAGCDLLNFLRASQPVTKDREIEVFPGDFNVEVDSILSSRRIGEKEATFCLLDQRTFECHWNTVKKLAGYRTGKPNKFELFYFLAGWWYRRAVTAIKRDSVLVNWWGRNDWPDLREKNLLAVKDEMVARFKSKLGYKSAKAWPILDKAGRDMYFMIHATDYLGAPSLMERAYSEAIQPAERAVQLTFFPAEEKS
jgi:three-Cys-motif partner protein